MKKLGIASVWLKMGDEALTEIAAIAKDFEILRLEADSPQIAECEILFGNPQRHTLENATNLRWLHTHTAWVDAYIGEGATLGENVILTNSSGAYGIGISEFMITYTLMLLKNMPNYLVQQRDAIWKSLGEVRGLYGAKVAVVGMGDIGSNFASRAKSMGAQVVGIVRSPRSHSPELVDKLFLIDELDEAIKDADIVALSLPGTKEVDNLFSRERIAKMKPGAIIINVGRGNAIDTDALVDALKSGHLGGAGLDVTNPEPLPQNHPLWTAPNVIITPHITGGRTFALTSELIVQKFLEYLRLYVAGEEFPRVVDRKRGY